MSDSPPLPYVAPRRVVALCYQPNDSDTASTAPALTGVCGKLAVLGSAGGLVVAEAPAASDSRSVVAHLSAVLGVPLSSSAPFSPLVHPAPDACSPAAVYPPQYGRLRVQLLTSSAVAERHVQHLINTPGHKDVAQHLLPPLLLTSQPLQRSKDLTAYITQLLRDKQSEANVLVVHVTYESLARERLAADEQLLPPLLEECLEQLLQLVVSGTSDAADGPLSDVYLAAIRLQPLQYTVPLASSPLASFIPQQSYQLSVPSASSTSALYLPLLAFHHNTTRSDACLYSSRPERFALGSGGLIAATDWLAELAFRLGEKAKYGA